MDSGNSGSMQSSSGGDEEYDSRPDPIPTFLNSSSHFNPISNPQHTHLSHHQSHSPSMFNPPSNYLDVFSQSPAHLNPNSLSNLDVVWSRSGQRSDPNCTPLGNLIGSSSSSQSTLGGAQGPSQGSFPSSSKMIRSVHEDGARPSASMDQTNVVRNPKKRTRASRRAPTTVLTTDTSNFRAMVQEFTGIPAPPFSASSSYSRGRFDLFGSGSSLRSGHLESLGPLYPLRPSPQKVQPTPFVSSSSSSASPSFLNSTMVDATNIASTTNNNPITTSMSAASNNVNSTSGNNNYQLPSDLGLLHKQPQNVLHMQNPILTFQSLLQSPLPPPFKYPLSGDMSSVFGTKSQGSSTTIHSLEELGMGHGGHMNANFSGFPNHVTNSDGRGGAGANDGSHQDHLRPPFNDNFDNSHRVSGFKLNCSASSSDFHPEKGLENVSSRGEGTVESWICPSD
ncbi:hypothetical protein L1049_025766 [Liquidambar formosana]|uniref:VQ domain-containing protein n=1 Tax=Liquidambar formosana TaxID=63359 RepID=A0AAP0NBW4_LIQFO